MCYMINGTDSLTLNNHQAIKTKLYLYPDDSNQIFEAKTESEMENTANLELSIVELVFNKSNQFINSEKILYNLIKLE